MQNYPFFANDVQLKLDFLHQCKIWIFWKLLITIKYQKNRLDKEYLYGYKQICLEIVSN